MCASHHSKFLQNKMKREKKKKPRRGSHPLWITAIMARLSSQSVLSGSSNLEVFSCGPPDAEEGFRPDTVITFLAKPVLVSANINMLSFGRATDHTFTHDSWATLSSIILASPEYCFRLLLPHTD